MTPTVEVRALLAGRGYLLNKILFNDTTPENENEPVKLPIWTFYIYHPGKDVRAMWDLGIFKDNSKHSPNQKYFVEQILKPEVPEDASDILTRHGIPPSTIDYALVSHMHLDHIGDPSLYPNATIVIGAGTQAHCRPAYPLDPSSKYLESSFPEGRTRELTEADYTTSVGPWPKAHDFFGDGSVLLIDAPGHMPGHQLALVNTEKGRLLLGGDSCHHCRHLTTFEKGKEMSYGMHENEEEARLNMERINAFLKENKDVKLCLAHVGEHGNGDFQRVFGYA